MAFLTSIAVTSALASSPAAAQSLSHFQNNGRAETRAIVGISVPNGCRRQAVDTRPTLNLRFDPSRIDADPTRFRSLDPLLANRRNQRASVFSLTLKNNPRLMLHGHSFARMGSPLYANGEVEDEKARGGRKEERGTGEKVLRGVGWAGIGALAIVGVGVGVFALSCGDGECFDEN
ncbi:MAG: hypothetical protein AAF559_09900 [Pseudomonadota bacterium]